MNRAYKPFTYGTQQPASRERAIDIAIAQTHYGRGGSDQACFERGFDAALSLALHLMTECNIHTKAHLFNELRKLERDYVAADQSGDAK